VEARGAHLSPSPVITMMHHIFGSLFYLFPMWLTAESILMPVFSD
jgi:hypothetical protein